MQTTIDGTKSQKMRKARDKRMLGAAGETEAARVDRVAAERTRELSATAPIPSADESLRIIAELRERNAVMAAALAEAKARPAHGLSYRVSDKGALSVYGLGRFPVTLYGEQWDRLLSDIDALRQARETFRDRLSVKAPRPAVTETSAQ